MIMTDYFALTLVLTFGAVGTLLGFGKTFRSLTKGVVGFMLSLVLSYYLDGVILSIRPVGDIAGMITRSLADSGNVFLSFLSKFNLDGIVLSVALFFIIRLTIRLAGSLVFTIAEADNTAMRIVNKSLGALFCVALLVVAFSVVMSFVYVVNGGKALKLFENSFFGLDRAYADNPLRKVFF